MNQDASQDAGMDGSNLFREDVFTDQKVGTIRRMTPVTADGADDGSRPVQYIGQATVMTPMGSLPLSFELDAATMAEAVSKFGPAAQRAVEEAAREIQEMRRQAASSIVIPDAGAAALKGMGGKGGGGIQMP
jgi:ribosomal protein L22